MSGKPFSRKTRRHTYSMAELRVEAQKRAEQRYDHIYVDENLIISPSAEGYWAEGDVESYHLISQGAVNHPLSLLPEGARVVRFSDLAMEFSQHPRGFALLSGVDRHAAGLEHFRLAQWGDQIGKAFSFCVNRKTYTALEKLPHRYGSELGVLIEREGNHCRNTFSPCALTPRFCRAKSFTDDNDSSVFYDHFSASWQSTVCINELAVQADTLELIIPNTKLLVLRVGTNRDYDCDVSFIAMFALSAFTTAQALGIAESFAFADELALNVPSVRASHRLRL